MSDSWDGLIMNLGNTKDLTMKLAVSMLFFEVSHRKSDVGFLADAMIVRGRSMEWGVNSKNNSRSKSKGKKNIRCWNFQKKGCLWKDCKFWKAN